MQMYIATILLCFIPGMIATLVRFVINKKKTGILRELLFYAASFMGVLAGIKCVVGFRTVTIFESFVDIDFTTFRNYLVLLLVMACIIPVVLYFITRDRYEKLIKLGVSFYFLFLSFGILLTDMITNQVIFLVVIAGACAALLSVFLVKEEVICCDKENWKKRILYSVISILCWIVMVYVYLPNELFLSNAGEFTVSFGSFESNLLVGALLLAVCLIVGSILLLTEKQWKLCCTVYAGVSVVGYIQTMFLNGRLMSMDGASQTWKASTVVVNTLIWGVLLGAILLLSVKLGKKMAKVLQIASVYIILIQMVSFLFLLLTSDTTTDKMYVLTTEERLEMNAENNVVVFVLDFFDEQIMEQIVEQDAEFLSPLADFVWYQNATSKYAFTDMSLPYLLTGVEWQNGMLEEDYRDYAYQNSTFLQEIAEQGYDIGIYTDASYVDSSVRDIVSNFSEGLARKSGISQVLSTMGKCSRYKLAPFVMKNWYSYATSEVVTGIIHDEIEGNGANELNVTAHDILSDVPFRHKLETEGMLISENASANGTFKLYHLYGAHAPYIMNENGSWLAEGETSNVILQSRGCMKILFKYIEQLKQLGIYDNTTIIITADHGQNFLFDESHAKSQEELGLEPTSSPIMFVKEKNAHHENGLVISKAPVSHEEVLATVMEAVGGDAQKYGRTFKEIGEDEERERVFIYGRYPDLEFLKCTIQGDVMNASNWKVEPIE